MIEKLVYGGSGLARMDGKVVLVPGVLPGERVRVAIERSRSDMSSARLEDVLEGSPDRVTPDVPELARAGAHYLHIRYERQLQLKVEILREVLQRVGKLAAPEDIGVISGEPWGYRNRSQFHLKNGRIGYLATGSHELIPIDRCPLSSPRVNEALKALRSMLSDRRFPGFVRAIEIFTNENDVQINVKETDRHVARSFFDWCSQTIPGYADGAIDYPAAGMRFRVGGGSFFQVNRFLVDRLVEVALGAAAGELALDLYAGVGLFSFPLARAFGKVEAVESSGAAVRDLEFNGERAKSSVAVRRQSSAAYLAAVGSNFDYVLADPPRAGLGKEVTRELIRLKPGSIGIVSCDPATLARDLAALLAAGYQIQEMVLVDLFPYTYHIETVTKLDLLHRG